MPDSIPNGSDLHTPVASTLNSDSRSVQLMDIGSITHCKIFPAIGIARVGNSPTSYFFGPEIPGEVVSPIGGFKDNGDIKKGLPPRVKRQAARFRIFAYGKDNTSLGEITTEEAEIEWTVHLVNAKAEADRFAGTLGEELPIGERRERENWRNADIEDRSSLIIDPGPRTIKGPNQSSEFDTGAFRGITVPLGRIATDEEGRLIVLGGFGNSGSSNPSQTIVNYANNNLWYDDISDGPVQAKVVLKSGHSISVAPAWVIVAPPDFAPSVPNIVTLYDVATDTALQHKLGPVRDASIDSPKFTEHIAPIFHRLGQLKWVQQNGRGAGLLYIFEDLDELAKAKEADRQKLFSLFRNPNLSVNSPEAKAQATSDFLPALSGDDGDAQPGNPQTWLSITKTQYSMLQKWANGDFENDWKGSFPTPPKDITPEGLTRAALEACAGGAFYPGIEGGWLLRNPAAYQEPFRLSHEKIKPGDVTKKMACPWQADFFECMWHWWPAQRPDEVLTLKAYRKLRDLVEEIETLRSENRDTEAKEAEKQKLLNNRRSWTRGLPERSFDGDMAMIEKWAQHGFVMTEDQDGEPFSLDNIGSLQVESERGVYDGLTWPEYFHILTNIEQHPDFLPKAREIAYSFFAKAEYDADEKFHFFEYSPEALDERMKEIYDAYVATINERSRMDTGIIDWPIVVRREGDKEITKNVSFDFKKPFSNKAVIERLKQRAPFNLVDGAWLQRIQSAGPTDDIRAHLFAIWDDESGNGKTEQNHCNVYDTLLRSQNIYMPPITSRQFIEQEFLPSAFIQPVFQLAVSLFPDEFFPELLGMTLYLEWEASPTLTPTVRHYSDRGINPHFYSLHVAIDNITAGHGFLAKEAIKLYLQQIEDEGGNEAVQEAWRRIWCGYVTWATAGDLGRDLLELCMILDYKQIDLNYPAMLLTSQIAGPPKLLAIFRSAATANKESLLSTFLVENFARSVQEQLRHYEAPNPPPTLVQLVVDELNKIIQGDENIFNEERFKGIVLKEDTKSILEKEPKGEDLVKLNRLLLRDGYAENIGDIPQMEPNMFPDYKGYFAKRFVEVIRRKAYAAKPLHRAVMIGNHNLSELFDTPERLLEILATSDLINIDHPRSSRFLDALSFRGPMYKIFTEQEIGIILDWIESLKKLATPNEPVPEPTPEGAALKVLQLIKAHAPIAIGVQRHSQYTVQGRSLKDWFDDPAGLMAAFSVSREWVVPGNSSASRLFSEFSTGRMSFMGQTVANEIKQWIDTGAVLVEGETGEVVPESASVVTSFIRHHTATFTERSNAIVEPVVAVDSAIRKIRVDEFAAKRKLIGMGSVH